MIQEEKVMWFVDHCGPRKDQMREFMKVMKGRGLYEAPASSAYHRSYSGGLIDHSLGVTETLVKLRSTLETEASVRQSDAGRRFEEMQGFPTVESCVIVGLCHDIHKACDWAGRPYYLPKVLKSGKVSESKPFERNEACTVLTGGYLSSLITSQYIDLFENEVQAISCHDGQYVAANKEIALKEHPLTVMLHFADYWNAIFMEDSSSWLFRQPMGVIKEKEEPCAV